MLVTVPYFLPHFIQKGAITPQCHLVKALSRWLPFGQKYLTCLLDRGHIITDWWYYPTFFKIFNFIISCSLFYMNGIIPFASFRVFFAFSSNEFSNKYSIPFGVIIASCKSPKTTPFFVDVTAMPLI